MNTPATPNSDGWISFVEQADDDLYHVSFLDEFRLPEDAAPDGRQRALTETRKRSALERLPDILQPPLADGGSTARLQP